LYDDGLRSFDYRTTVVKCFIKNESYPKYKYPRAILARSDEFKVLVGPVFKLIENHIFSLKTDYNSSYFIKKVPVPNRARAILDVIGTSVGHNDPGTADQFLRRYVVTDYTSFESSFTKDIINNCEMKLYEHCVSCLPEGKAFMGYLETIVGQNRCFFSNINFSILARRMSGEMNTSLGNGFSNLMLTLFVMFEIGARDVRLFVEGDDCILTYVGPMFQPSLVLKLGFKIKFVFLRSPNLASFCGQIFDLTHLVIVCDPLKIILNFAWVNMRYVKSAHRIKMGLVRSRALSLIYQYSGCPIVQCFAWRMLELTERYEVYFDETVDGYHRQLYTDALKHIPQFRPIQFTSREIIEDVFNITVDHQIIIEAYFSSYKFGPIDLYILRNYCTYDQLHYYDNYIGPYNA